MTTMPLATLPNEAIRYLRENREMSQEELAKEARLSVGCIKRLEKDNLFENPMLASTAERIAVALKVGKTCHDLVDVIDVGYGIISDINRDVNKKHREPEVQMYVCVIPTCNAHVPLMELERNGGNLCDNCGL